MNDKEIFEKSLTLWGFQTQILMLAEEAAELSVATLHLLRRAKEENSFVDFCGEVADVEFMLKELKYYLEGRNVKAEIKKAEREKRKRLIARIKFDEKSKGVER